MKQKVDVTGNGSKCEKCGDVIRPFQERFVLNAEHTRFEHIICPPKRY